MRLEKSKMPETEFPQNVLTGLLPEEIFDNLELSQSFRAKQIFKWVGNGAKTFDQMTNLSLDLRNELKKKLFFVLLKSKVFLRTRMELLNYKFIFMMIILLKLFYSQTKKEGKLPVFPVRLVVQ